ncbi:hypothetical protein JTB14_021402 [Gonioctena quinquepunctata]|nr:hypothetical protein JTB14_021402 [Gonioctena quinquepunctata]
MFRVLSGALRLASSSIIPTTKLLVQNVGRKNAILPAVSRSFSSAFNQYTFDKPRLLQPYPQVITDSATRTVTKFSFRKGKRKSVKAVLKRFYRLEWGGWIRTKCGRNKKLWKKSPPRKRRLRQHVLCNGQQSYMLDKMVGPYWRKPKYYIEDPYEPYHSRGEFSLATTKPRPYFPPEN